MHLDTATNWLFGTTRTEDYLASDWGLRVHLFKVQLDATTGDPDQATFTMFNFDNGDFHGHSYILGIRPQLEANGDLHYSYHHDNEQAYGSLSFKNQDSVNDVNQVNIEYILAYARTVWIGTQQEVNGANGINKWQSYNVVTLSG